MLQGALRRATTAARAGGNIDEGTCVICVGLVVAPLEDWIEVMTHSLTSDEWNRVTAPALVLVGASHEVARVRATAPTRPHAPQAKKKTAPKAKAESSKKKENTSGVGTNVSTLTAHRSPN